MSPIDKDAYFDVPDLFTPKYEEAHISCTFTWDIQKANDLAIQWRKFAKVVKLGGVAIDGESNQPFQAGMYLKQGVTITTRGCPNKKYKRCPFCGVNENFIEFDVFPKGNINQDNNLLACSQKGWDRRMEMFSYEKGIELKGGLDKFLLTRRRAEDLRSLSIKSLWLACDQDSGIEPLRKAVKILFDVGFTRSHLYCYVLIGDNARENIHRLREVYKMGCMPFAQLFKNKENDIKYHRSWKHLQRRWDLPAIIRKRCKSITPKGLNEKAK
jgi:hypothetical protein